MTVFGRPATAWNRMWPESASMALAWSDGERAQRGTARGCTKTAEALLRGGIAARPLSRSKTEVISDVRAVPEDQCRANRREDHRHRAGRTGGPKAMSARLMTNFAHKRTLDRMVRRSRLKALLRVGGIVLMVVGMIFAPLSGSDPSIRHRFSPMRGPSADSAI